MTAREISAVAEKAVASVKFREAQMDDYESITALQARNGLGTKTREEWEHLWLGNPLYRRMERWPIGIVGENDHGEIVAYTACIPLSYYFHGREIPAVTGWGMAVDPPYRGNTIFLIRRVLNPRTQAALFFDASARPNVARIMERIAPRFPGAGRVPNSNWGSASFWITNYRGFARSFVRSKRLPDIFVYGAAPAVWFKDKLKRSNIWPGENGPKVEVHTEVDERFDIFWEELKKAYPHRLLATRSREVLHWHFKYPLASGRAWLLTVSDKSRMLAYGVFWRQDNKELNLTRVRLLDFQVVNGDLQLVVPMLEWAFSKCRREGIHMLESYGLREDKQKVIDDLAPHRRRLPAWAFFYATYNKDLGQKLQDPNVWDPSHFDGDASL